MDTSALAAIALAEPEHQAFSQCIARQGAIIGAPTLELSLVLTPRLRADASLFIDGLLAVPGIRAVAFDLVQFRLAADAFVRFGRGVTRRGSILVIVCLMPSRRRTAFRFCARATTSSIRM